MLPEQLLTGQVQELIGWRQKQVVREESVPLRDQLEVKAPQTTMLTSPVSS